MKLSKTELKHFIGGCGGCDWNGDIYIEKKNEQFKLSVLNSIKDGTLEIDGYEKVNWVMLNPDDPNTFPPKDVWLDIFEKHKNGELFRAVNKLTEFWMEEILKRWINSIKSRGSIVYWRLLPPPPL